MKNSEQKSEKVFYENIGGSEPYHVNRYLRPKGLTTFKLTRSPSENENEFLKRKDLYK